MVDRFQHLFDSLTEEAVVIDRDLRIAYANPAWMRRVGLAPSQILGQTCHHVLLNSAIACATEICAVQRVFKTGQPLRLTCEGVEQRTRERQGQISASPVFDAAGQVTQVIQILVPQTLPPPAGQPSLLPEEDIQRQKVAEALREVALIAGSGQGLQVVLDAILDQLRRVVAFDSASIMLIRGGKSQLIAGCGFPDGLILDQVVFAPDDEKIAWMQKTRQPMIIHDVQKDKRWKPIPGTEFIRSWIGAPLLAQGRMIGTLNVDKAEPGHYRPEDAKLVMAFANQAAVVIENARLLEAERQRVAHLSLIGGISQHILSILDPAALLDYAVKAIQSRFGYDHVDIFLTDLAGEYQVFQVSSHAEYASVWREQGMRFRIGVEGIIGHVAATGQPHVANDVQQEPHYIPDKLLTEARSELAVPIKVGKRIIGVLDLNSADLNAFDDSDVVVAQSLADQLAVGLENARLYEATQHRVAELEAVRQASLSLTASLELQPVLEAILESTLDLLTGAQDAHVFLYHDDQLTFGAALWADGRKGQPWSDPRPQGLTYTVARQGQVIVVPNMRTHPLFADAPSEWEGAIVGLPLTIGQRVVGVMSVAFHQPRTLPEAELRALHLLADQAAIAIENARLFEETRGHVARLEKKARDLEMVHQVSRLISSSLDLNHILDTTAEQMATVFEADHSSIVLFDQDRRHGRLVAEYPSTGAKGESFPVAGYLGSERLMTKREPLQIEDVQSDSLMATLRETVQRLDIRSTLILPLIVKGEVIGSIGLDAIGHKRRFDDEEVALAQIMANQVAYAVENARLYAETEKRLREQIALREAGTMISSALDLETVLGRIAEQMGRAVTATSAYICSFEAERATSTVLAEYFGPRACSQERVSDLGVTCTEEDVEALETLQAGQHHTFHIDDRDLVESKRAHMQQYGAQSVMYIPLLVKGELLGFAGLRESRQHREFTPDEIALCQGIAQQAAIALENAGLYQEMQQRLKELTLLFDTSAAISTSLDPDTVLQTTVQQITTALGVEGCAISVWDREQDILVTIQDHSPDPDWWAPQPPGTIYHLADFPLTLQVLAHRQPFAVQVDDPDADEAEVAWMVAEEVKSLLLVPMVVRDNAIGLLELMECKKEREFTPTEVSICQTLANQAAAAWENARLFQETEARAREMTALAAVGQAMTTLELDEVLDSITENAQKAAQAQISSVYLLDENQRRLTPRSVRGRHRQELEQACFDLGEGTIGLVAQSGQPLIVSDTATESAFVPKSKASRQIRNTLTVPLAVKGRVIGTLEVCNKIGADRFTAADQRLLTAFAAQAAIAIDNARLYQEVSQHLEDALILNQVAAAAASSLDFDEVIRRGLAALVGVRNFERVHVMLLDPARRDLWLHPASADGTLFPSRPSFRMPLGQGITGWVAETGQSLRIADVRQEPRYEPGYPDTLSELCVPLRAGDRIIGVFDTQSTRLDAFSENDERLLTTLTSQLSTVLENSRLFAEAHQRVREQTALMEVSQALNEAQDLQTTLDVVLEEAFALLDSREGSIILIEPPGSNRLSMVAERGLGSRVLEAFNSRPVYTHEGTYKRALRSGRIVEVADTAADPDFLHDVGSGAKAVTNIPLMTERGAIGLIALEGLPKDDTTRRLLTALADMAAVAIDKERLHQETSVRLAEVSTLYTLSTQITSSLSLTSVLDSIVAILKLTLDCRSCSIFLVDPTGEFLQLEAASGPSSDWKGIARMRVGEAISGRAIVERRSVYIPDTHLEPDFVFFDPAIRSLLVMPLIVRDRAIGTLSIDDTTPNAFHEEVRLLTIAAAQAAVAIENAQLYESLQNSYTDLERTYDELRQLDRMKSELIQNVSHELRTPLTFIKGYIELLQDGEMGELLEEQRMALDIVANKAEVLSRLVDDIISMQKVGREQLHFEPVSLADVGHAAVQAAQASALEAGVTLNDEIPDGIPPVLGDKQRLGQVFDNLLQNAIKFSHAGDSVTVRMFTDQSVIRTEVEDTGIGIPTNQLGRIFDRFYQVDGTTTRRFGGAGLGLAIVKQIVETHNGQVGVKSEPDKGSLFHFTIPVAHPDQMLGGQ